MADLVNAVVLGTLTNGGAGGIVFPLVLIPAYGVPRAFLIHSYSLIGLLRKTSQQPRQAESLNHGDGRPQDQRALRRRGEWPINALSGINCPAR